DHFVLVFCSVYAIAAICNIIYLISLKKVSFKPDFKHLTKSLQKSFLYYTLFLLIGTLIGSITATINTFFVSAKMGLAYTGIFSIATYIAAIIEIPYRSLGAITQPQIAQTVKENNFDETSKLCKNISLHQFIVSTFLFFTIWVNIQLIFQILPNGSEYMAGIWVVFFLGLTRIITSSFGVGISILGYSKYYYYSLFLSILLAGTAIFLNLWLIPLYGIEGAALATFLSTCLDSIFLLTLNKIKLNITPFSIAQLKIVLILLLMFGFNRIWNFALTPLFSQLPIKELYCSILSNSLGTFFTLGAGIVILYCWKVSETVNHLIRKAFKII
ncbi:MAG: polysaccharide biosynthesis C-terminal domain-containing protein, partial [Bacteroidales bacterium]